MLRPLSPVTLVVFCWAVTLGVAGATLARIERFDLIPIFMDREALELAAFTGTGAAWIATALVVYCVADLGTSTALPARRAFRLDIDLDRAAHLVFWTNAGLLGITGLWIVLTAAQVGGLMQLAALAYLDALGARDLLLQNKLFTGMRLFYAALPATGCFAAAILAADRHGQLSTRSWRLCQAVLIINAAALVILPIVMSQRLLLLQFILSAYVTACLIKGRMFGLGYLGLGLGLFLTTWVLRESVTNAHFTRSAVDVGLQKLAFYFVNDLWNSFAPLQHEIAHTYGAFSLKGLMFFTFTDGYFARVLAPQLAASEEVRGGGDFSIFTAPFVDFGPYGAALYIALAAGLFRYAFHRGRERLVWAALYGQIGAALMFCTHGIYFTHQNFLFSLIVIALLARAARRTPHPARGMEAAPSAQPVGPLSPTPTQRRPIFRTKRPRPVFVTRRAVDHA